MIYSDIEWLAGIVDDRTLTYTREYMSAFLVKKMAEGYQMRENEMKPEVSVFMPTYNRKDYIEQALESVLMQEVSFPYEIVIHDDASTDGTVDIIKAYEKRYPDIVKCVYQKENQFSQGNVAGIWDCYYNVCRGTYCAILESDDYWTDTKKMQRQYDYMETHPECSMYMHNAWRLDEQTGKKVLLDTFPKSGYYSQREQVLCGLGSKFPATCSYFFRLDSLRENLPTFVSNVLIGDYSIRQILANKGAVYYDKRPMSVYRYMSNGSFMKNIRENLDAYVHYALKMCVYYKCMDEYLENRFHDIYLKKTNSDILGLAAATYDCREEIPYIDAEWLKERLDICYEMLEGKRWLDFVKNQLETDEAVWIYGTSRLATICKQSLERVGICIKGFVVSDGYSKPETYENCSVKYVSETSGEHDYYVVAAQPINLDSIEQMLIANGEKRYCFPYALQKEDS